MSAAGNWRAGLGQLVRSPRAVGSLGILLIVVLGCVLAPVYAWFAGNVDPFAANPVGTVMVHGVSVPLLQPAAGGLGVVPVGPTGDPRLATCSAPTEMAGTSLYGCSTAVGTPCRSGSRRPSWLPSAG
ncbi:hypothetical protein [Fodinicola feengrottensis]|uniref:hypothetical protein n=1 Tax=Fodinicola feengrottensis TaxID=435914 RepID=UPI002441503B|nr:hypothetical protein [Fodinicola feengrottensis]